MAILERIERMEDREIQSWLRNVDPTTLSIAMLGASEAVRGRVTRNMSRNAAAVIDESVKRLSSMDGRQLLIYKCGRELEALMEAGG